jgi:acetyltransferase-like isoleucine patch superfamily enzyme
LTKITEKIFKRIFYYGGKYFKESQYKKNILNGLLTVGKHSYGKPEIILHTGDKNKVLIGKYCSIADEVKIFVGGNHHSEWVSTYPIRAKFDLPGKFEDGQPFSNGDVVIGNDVWIGYNTLILSGVTIGDGAIVAANSVVTKNVPPFTIVGGNPAKLIRKRFSDEEITHLQKIKWWDWDEKKILSNVDLLCSPNLDSFINKHNKN